MAKTTSAVKRLLEQEILTLKGSHIKTLKSTAIQDNDAEEENEEQRNINSIFFQNDKFSFDDLDNFTIDFTPVSCVSNNDSFSFSQVNTWMENMARS